MPVHHTHVRIAAVLAKHSRISVLFQKILDLFAAAEGDKMSKEHPTRSSNMQCLSGTELMDGQMQMHAEAFARTMVCVCCADLLSRDTERNRSLHALLGDLPEDHVGHAELNVETRRRAM